MRENLLKEIVDREFRMFQSLLVEGLDRCKDNPKTFRLVRTSYFSVFSEETLLSYLEDLKRAEKEGRNLLEEKYARMDGKIPSSGKDPRIEEIVSIRSSWMRELALKYPGVFEFDEGKFANYSRSELETYSGRTLELMLQDHRRALDEGRNLIREQYDLMFGRIGLSLEELEERRREKEMEKVKGKKERG